MDQRSCSSSDHSGPDVTRRTPPVTCRILRAAEQAGRENEQPDELAAAAAARCPSRASVSSCARVSFRTQMSLRCAVIIRLVVPSREGRMTPRIVNGKLVYPPPSRDSREVIT